MALSRTLQAASHPSPAAASLSPRRETQVRLAPGLSSRLTEAPEVVRSRMRTEARSEAGHWPWLGSWQPTAAVDPCTLRHRTIFLGVPPDCNKMMLETKVTYLGSLTEARFVLSCWLYILTSWRQDPDNTRTWPPLRLERLTAVTGWPWSVTTVSRQWVSRLHSWT